MDDLERLLGPDRRWQGDWLQLCVGAIALLVVIGLAVLWPRSIPDFQLAEVGFADAVVPAEVSSATEGECSYAPEFSCLFVVFELTDGSDVSASQEFDISATSPRLETGDRVVLNVINDADPRFRYQYADRDRRGLLALVGIGFALAVVVLGRLRGVAALGGLLASVGILLWFVAPAILAGRDPVAVAAIGGGAIALVALYLAHGWRTTTHIAALGTFAALGLTMLLSWLVTPAAAFSGFASEEALFLSILEGVRTSGLVLAGAILGAIGALDDVTVTQVSTVYELRAANPGQTARQLYQSGLRVGRDHIASTINTLLLAYAGASMPLLLLLTLSNLSISLAANSEVVAVEIVRTIVGSIGLIAAVPITTLIAARTAVRPATRRHRRS
ncbi:MAG TPA: YibE/F family protein [Acidimicrobiia bacterium]